MQTDNYLTAFKTQSQNALAKFAILVDELFIKFADSTMNKKSHEWNKLENTVLCTSFDAFLFIGSTFYFKMLNKIINGLIPTGIMNHLIEECCSTKWKFEKVQKIPKVLKFYDLGFVFNFWLGSCLVSIFAFVAEHVVKFLEKNHEIKPSEDHPDYIPVRVQRTADLE